MRTDPLRDLALRLRDVGELRERPDRVTALLSRTVIPWQSAAPYLRLSGNRYTRNLVYRNDCFELLLLCWDAGSRSPIHGHSGQRCWFMPVAGWFDLEDY